MTEAWIGLGANLGDRTAKLDAALEQIDHLGHTHLERVSRFYFTPPWGDADQPEFANAAVVVQTRSTPAQLLSSLHDIESQLGRVRGDRRWGPRVIDLDLLVFGDARIDGEELIVPHPRVRERAFVLVPLHELAPELDIPGQGRVDALLAALDDNERAGIRPGPRPGYSPENKRRELAP